MGLKVDENDLAIFFAGMALSGCANNIQQNPDQIAKHAVTIGIATRKEFIARGLLPGVRPVYTLDELVSRAKSGDLEAQGGITEMIENLKNASARSGSIRGIPGDGTFVKDPNGNLHDTRSGG